MASVHYPIGRVVAATLLTLTTASQGWSQQKAAPVDPVETGASALKNEIRATDLQQYYMFKDTTQYKDHSATKAIVRTKEGGLSITLLQNGQAAQRRRAR